MFFYCQRGPPTMPNYIPDPASEAGWAIETFLDGLAEEATTSPLSSQLRNQLDGQFVRYEEKYRHWLPDEAARYALRQGVAVLTAYRLYEEAVSTPTLLAILRRC